MTKFLLTHHRAFRKKISSPSLDPEPF